MKALYRTGKVLAHLGDMEEAIIKLQKALSQNPEDKIIQMELQRTVKKKEVSDRKEKEMCRRMVSGDTTKEDKPKLTPAATKDSSWASI